MGKTYAQGRKRHDYPKRAPVWTDEALLQRLRDWAAIHGGPPAYGNWHTGHAELHPDWKRGEWPSSFVYVKRFGSWTNAVRLAGLEPRLHQPRAWTPVKACPVCGGRFERRHDEVRTSFMRRKFCSRRCMVEAARKAALWDVRVRGALALRLMGRTNAEIAEALGTTGAAVANLLSRAKRRGYDVPRAPYPRV